MTNTRKLLAIAVLTWLAIPTISVVFAEAQAPAEVKPAAPAPPSSTQPKSAESAPSEPSASKPAAEPAKADAAAPTPSPSAPAVPTAELAADAKPAGEPAKTGAAAEATKTPPSVTAAQASPPTPPSVLTQEMPEIPVSEKKSLQGYQLIPGETRFSDQPPRRQCGRGYTAGVLPFGEPPLGPRGRVDAEIGVTSKSEQGDSRFWLSPILRAQYRILDTLALTADWGFSYTNYSPEKGDTEDRFRTGNPFIGVHSARRHGCTELRVGLGATVPLARLPQNDQYDVFPLYYGAMAIRGMWEWWLWYPNAMTVALPVSWETVINDHWVWGGSIILAGTGVLGVRPPQRTFNFLTAKPRRSHLLVPMSVHAGYHVGPAILGTYIQSVFILTGVGDKQLSIIPFAKLGLGDGYLEARFTLNIDEPLGLSFSDHGYYGVQLGGGYGF